jgi:hypothetical protein
VNTLFQKNLKMKEGIPNPGTPLNTPQGIYDGHL